MINEHWVSSWDDVYSIKTYDLPNLESPNWFVTLQLLIVWIIPIRKVFQLRFQTLDADGVTAEWYDWSSRCISQVRCPRRNQLASDSACVTGTLTLTWAESADSLCRGRHPRTLSLRNPRGVNRVLTPSTLSTNAFRNVRFTKSESVVYLQVLAFMS